MTNQRRGKIARLPLAIREELNERMQNGHKGAPLLEWLNSLPAVREMLAVDFDGQPVCKQNLSRWRRGGYRDWLLEQGAMEAMRHIQPDSQELSEKSGGITNNMALWIAARYLVAVKGMQQKDAALDWQHLREFCNDIVKLRRGDHIAARLELDAKRRRLQEIVANNRLMRSLINTSAPPEDSCEPSTQN